MRRAALKVERMEWTAWAENRLAARLRRLLGSAFDEVLTKLQQRGRVPSDSAAQQALLAALRKKEPEFISIIQNAALDSAGRGRQQVYDYAKTVPHAPDFTAREFSERVKKLIKDHAFEASERTMARMRGDVMGNLARSYEEGLGIRDAADRLRDQFDSMEEYELKRVARTETNSFQNMGAHETCRELTNYEQWWGADDDRSRGTEPQDLADHTLAGMHGQIVAVDDPFSNGLQYPGDRSGGEATIHEWINCRCRVVPFFIPQGYKAPPGATYFYEYDLVYVGDG